ncbi:MAG: hypothetical protein ABI923_09180 [bacterium]
MKVVNSWSATAWRRFGPRRPGAADVERPFNSNEACYRRMGQSAAWPAQSKELSLRLAGLGGAGTPRHSR